MADPWSKTAAVSKHPLQCVNRAPWEPERSVPSLHGGEHSRWLLSGKKRLWWLEVWRSPGSSERLMLETGKTRADLPHWGPGLWAHHSPCTASLPPTPCPWASLTLLQLLLPCIFSIFTFKDLLSCCFLRQILSSIFYNLVIYCAYCLFLSPLTTCLKRRIDCAWVMGGDQALPVSAWIKYWRLRESKQGNMGLVTGICFPSFWPGPMIHHLRI